MNAAQLVILTDELTTDQLARGYSAMSNQEAADDLNTIYRDDPNPITDIEGAVIWNAIDVADYDALAVGDKEMIDMIGAFSGAIPIGAGLIKTKLFAMFGVGTTSRDSLIALTVPPQISRGQELDLGVVGEGDVWDAREGPSSAFQDQSLYLGRKTFAGAGGVAPQHTGSSSGWSIAAGNPAGHLQIDVATGAITPSAAGTGGLLAAYPLTVTAIIDGYMLTATVTVNTQANAYSVRLLSELVAVLDLGDAALSGQTILIRPGFYEASGPTLNFFGRFTALTQPLTIASHEQNSRAQIDSWSFVAPSGTTGNLTFEYIDFFRTQQSFVDAGIGQTAADLVTIGQNTGSENIIFRHCRFYSDVLPGYQQYEVPHWVQGIVVSRTCAGLTVDDSEFHSLVRGMSVAGSAISVQRNVWWNSWTDFINLVPPTPTGNTDGVTIKDNIYYNQNANGFRLHPDCCQSFRRGTDTGDIANVRITGNVVFIGPEGIRQLPAIAPNFVLDATPLTTDFTIVFPADDDVLYQVDTTAGAVIGTLPSAGSVANGSTVCIQRLDGTNSLTMTGTGLGNYVMTAQWQSVSFTSNGVDTWSPQIFGPTLQGVFSQTLGGGAYQNWEIDGNVIFSNTAHGISWEIPATGINAHHNTLCRVWPGDVNGDGKVDESDGFYPFTTPMIRMNGDNSVSAHHNVAEDAVVVAGTPFLAANDTSLDRSSIATYQALFQGTVFMPTTATEALNDVRAKVGGTLFANKQGAVGTTLENGYYNFTTRTVNWTAPILANPAGTATGTTTADTTVDVTTGSGTVYVVCTTSATAPSAAQVKAGQDHAGSPASSANSVVTTFNALTLPITGLTESTEYWAHFVQETSEFSDVVTSADFTTEIVSGFSTVRNDGTTYWNRGGGWTGISDSAEGTLVFRTTAQDLAALRYILTDDGPNTFFRLNTGTNLLNFRLIGAGLNLSGNSTLAFAAVDGMFTCYVSWNLASGQEAFHIYKNDTDATPSVTIPVGVVDLTQADWGLFGRPTGSDLWGATDHEFAWFDPTYYDVSQQSIRDAWLAQNIGPDGSGPGAQPVLYRTGNAATWDAGTNLGTGGDLTKNGSNLMDV